MANAYAERAPATQLEVNSFPGIIGSSSALLGNIFVLRVPMSSSHRASQTV